MPHKIIAFRALGKRIRGLEGTPALLEDDEEGIGDCIDEEDSTPGCEESKGVLREWCANGEEGRMDAGECCNKCPPSPTLPPPNGGTISLGSVDVARGLLSTGTCCSFTTCSGGTA